MLTHISTGKPATKIMVELLREGINDKILLSQKSTRHRVLVTKYVAKDEYVKRK